MLNIAILEMLAASHLEHFKKLSDYYRDGIYTLESFLEESCLSINVGRQYGHSTFLKQRFEQDPYTFLFFDKKKQISGIFNISEYMIQKEKRFVNVLANNRGVRYFLEDNKIYTILVDRQAYNKSNRNICIDVAKLLRENFRPFHNIKNVRLIIVG